MTKLREIYKCNVCGNIVEVFHVDKTKHIIITHIAFILYYHMLGRKGGIFH